MIASSLDGIKLEFRAERVLLLIPISSLDFQEPQDQSSSISFTFLMYRDSVSVCGGSGLQGKLGCTPAHSSSSLLQSLRSHMHWNAKRLASCLPPWHLLFREDGVRGARVSWGLYSFISFRDSVGGGAGIAFSHDISIHLYK